MLKAACWLTALFPIGCQSSPSVPTGPGDPVRLGRIPASAEIVFHQDRFLYVMDGSGGSVTQITLQNPRAYEHVAVSFDRRFMAANEQLPNPSGEPGGRSRLWLFDLVQGTEARLLPHFVTAGNGGIAFGPDGYLYFAAKESDVFAEPRTPQELIANAAANDVYRIRADGTGPEPLTRTTDRGEADVSVSADGSLVTFMALAIHPPDDFTEIWVVRPDGTGPRLVYEGGTPRIASVHDPEVSPDNARVIFSQVNPDVPPNFPDLPEANTAHDLYSIGLDGSGFTRLTRPGPISIVPHWKGERIVYLELNDAEDYLGVSLIGSRQPDQTGTRIRRGGASPRWIP